MLYLTVDRISNIAHFFTLLLIFAFVIAVCYFTTRYIANIQRGRINSSSIKIIETMRIATNKYLQIINVGSKYFLIAVCKDTITYISELESDDISAAAANPQEIPGFKDILEKAKARLGGMNKDISVPADDTEPEETKEDD